MELRNWLYVENLFMCIIMQVLFKTDDIFDESNTTIS